MLRLLRTQNYKSNYKKKVGKILLLNHHISYITFYSSKKCSMEIWRGVKNRKICRNMKWNHQFLFLYRKLLSRKKNSNLISIQMLGEKWEIVMMEKYIFKEFLRIMLKSLSRRLKQERLDISNYHKHRNFEKISANRLEWNVWSCNVCKKCSK